MSTNTYHLTPVSNNKKTGPIAVTTTSANSCPDACPFKTTNECYAKLGPLAMHWAKNVTVSFVEHIKAIRSLVRGQKIRLNQAGDLPGINNNIDSVRLASLDKACKGLRAWSYTHKPLTPHNKKALRALKNITINVSTESAEQADKAIAQGFNAVMVVPMDYPKQSVTPKGNKVVVCPAVLNDKVTCKTCNLCSMDRNFVVAFRAHGVKGNSLSNRLKVIQ